MGGAISLEEIKRILEDSGFRDIDIELDEVTDEYARKWEYGLKIKDYIANGVISAFK